MSAAFDLEGRLPCRPKSLGRDRARPSIVFARSTSGPGGARMSGGGRERTVYILSGSRPKPAQIKTGISDGVVTEVLEGLKEGDRVVTAELSTAAATSSPAANPFTGGRRFP